jgi:hypothetical protein
LRSLTDLLKDEEIGSTIASRSPCSRLALDGARQSQVLWRDRQTGQMLDIVEHIRPARSSPEEPTRASRRRKPGRERGVACRGERHLPA